jgi:glycosyltransferase involved in cell wall biosynthesis
MKKRLAFITPLPPAASGIALFSRRILPMLAEKFDVSVFTENLPPDIPGKVEYEILPLNRFEINPAGKDFDAVLYQIGSNKIHCGIYLSAILRPGIAMLHEYVLHHLVKATTIGAEDNEAYTAEFKKYYGSEGEEMARLVHTGRAANETLFFHYPFFGRITERSLALITTTETSKNAISAEYPTKKIHYSPICSCIDTSNADRVTARKALALGDEFIIGIFGLITHAKKTGLVLDVFGRLRKKYPNIRLLLAGGVDPYYDLDKDIAAYEIDGGIIRTGRLSDGDYRRWLAAADVCVNLRYPIGGESSSALIEMMEAAKTIILPKAAQFLEIPEDCARHIPLGRNSADYLEAAVEEFIENPARLDDIGKKAKAYSIEHFSPEKITSSLIDILEEISDSKLLEPPPLGAEEKERFEKLYRHFVLYNKGSGK